MTALVVREVGKPWEDADAEVCEAIDFLRFYALGAREMAEELVQAPGERNELRLRPRGPAAVISPWNFPLSIPCGMVSAALVMGSPVLFKPAEQSPACGWELARLLLEAGVDADALALLPAAGDLGRWLVAEPRIATIAFTGSVAVGLEIQRRAHAGGGPAPDQADRRGAGRQELRASRLRRRPRRGGPRHGALGLRLRGQKCSAASRALVHEGVADRFAERLAGAVELLRVGPAEDFATEVPALIDPDAVAKFGRYADASKGAELARAKPAGGPQYVAPLLVDGDRLPAETPVLREEIFGPLLTVERVRDLDEAADRVQDLPQALTAGVFSRQPDRIRRADRAPSRRRRLRRPSDHGGHRRAPAVRRQPPVRNRRPSRRPHAISATSRTSRSSRPTSSDTASCSRRQPRRARPGGDPPAGGTSRRPCATTRPRLWSEPSRSPRTRRPRARSRPRPRASIAGARDAATRNDLCRRSHPERAVNRRSARAASARLRATSDPLLDHQPSLVPFHPRQRAPAFRPRLHASKH